MNHNLPFDFTVHKDNNTIEVTRAFAANLDLVWAAWTTPAILDQWWAPKPYRTETKSMDFRNGGTWLYSMVSPEGEKHWCRADYENIEVLKHYSGLDAFCDEAGTINESFPRSHWTNTFTQEGKDVTNVHIVIRYKSLADLESIIQLGFKEGFTMALGNLDQYIEAQQKLRAELKKDNSPRVCSYLNFPGNTEEAFLFYRSVFQTEFLGGIQRFGDLPPNAEHPPVADSIKKMILHIELPIVGNHVLMGTDAPKEMGFTVVQGNNMHISLEPETREETKRVFDALSEGGVISMPLQDMFWGAYFGSFTDRFGINWMLNFAGERV
jgi:PhnB protein